MCDQRGLCVWPCLAPSDTSWGHSTHSKAQYQCAVHSGTSPNTHRGKHKAWWQTSSEPELFICMVSWGPRLSLSASHTHKYLAFHLGCCLPSISQQCSHWGARCWSAARACCLFAGLSCLSCYVGHQESNDSVYIH